MPILHDIPELRTAFAGVNLNNRFTNHVLRKQWFISVITVITAHDYCIHSSSQRL